MVVALLTVCDAGVQFNLSKSGRSSPSSPLPAVVLSATPSASELLFVSYLRQYEKVYTAAELERRFEVFSANVALIDAHNAGQSSTHRLGITAHADWTEAEFRQHRLGYRRPSSSAQWAASGCNTAVYSSAVPTASLDWRTSNAVSGVKNQGGQYTLYRQPLQSPHLCLDCALFVSHIQPPLLLLFTAVCSPQVNVARVGRSPLRAVWRGCGPFVALSCCH